MATTYQLVPYLLKVNVRGKPLETRPINDLDGSGATLSEAVLRIFDGLRGRELVDPADDNRKLRLNVLRGGDRTAFIELGPGRSGIVSRLERAPADDGGSPEIINRTRRDTEYIPVRHAFYYPAGSHYATLLAERVGVSGAVTFLAQVLRKTFNAYYPDLVLDIVPAVTGEVMRKMAEGRPVKSLVFTRPRPSDTSGKMLMVAGEAVEVEVRVKTPRRRRWGWKALSTTAGEVTRDSLLGLLAPALGSEASDGEVQRLLDENWQAAIELTLPNGAVRTVNVASSDAVTMSFPIPERIPSDDRPDELDFTAACHETLKLFDGQFGLHAQSIGGYRWDDAEWTPAADDKRWKVAWDEPGQPATDLA